MTNPSKTEFQEIEDSYLNLQNELDPVSATHDGIVSYDAKYGRYGEQAIQPYLSAIRQFISKLESVKPVSLQEEVDRVALLNNTKMQLYSMGVERIQESRPDFWLSHMFHGIYYLVSQADRSSEQKLNGLIGRIKDIPLFLTNAQETLKTPSQLFIQSALEMISDGVKLIETLPMRFEHMDGSKVGELDRLTPIAIQSLTQFANHLKSQLKTADNKFAVGEKSFVSKLKYEQGINYSPAQILRYGFLLKSSLERELEQQAKELGSNDWIELADKLREEHPSEGSLLSLYKRSMARAKLFIEEKEIVTLPNIKIQVVTTPSFMINQTPFAAYNAPSLNAKRKVGEFYVTVPSKDISEEEKDSLLRDHCDYEIDITSVHEGFPGHHVQLATAIELPSKTRRNIKTSATDEGWATYCESMMREQGFYNDKKVEFFQTLHLLWRAVRIILDIQIHIKNMSVEDATKYLVESVHIGRKHAEAEVLRYCASPTNQLSYAIGRYELMNLRKDFFLNGKGETLKDFHDEVLKYGGIPISLMRFGMKLK